MRIDQARPLVSPIDHTGDLGLAIAAPDLATLLEAATLGLIDVMVDATAVAPVEARLVRVAGDDRELLLVNLLREVLFQADANRWLAAEAEATIGEGGRQATVRLLGEPFDPARHPFRTSVKAVTYHALEVREQEGGLRARVILDL